LPSAFGAPAGTAAAGAAAAGTAAASSEASWGSGTRAQGRASPAQALVWRRRWLSGDRLDAPAVRRPSFCARPPACVVVGKMEVSGVASRRLALLCGSRLEYLRATTPPAAASFYAVLHTLCGSHPTVHSGMLPTGSYHALAKPGSLRKTGLEIFFSRH
jgi:hypothetical protein